MSDAQDDIDPKRQARIALAREILSHPKIGRPVARATAPLPVGQQAISLGNLEDGLSVTDSDPSLEQLLQKKDPVLYFKPSFLNTLTNNPIKSLSLSDSAPSVAIERKELEWLQVDIQKLLKKHGVAEMCRVHIVCDPKINAFAMADKAGPIILISTGILQQADRSVIHQVVAHEVGHVCLNHVKELAEALKNAYKSFPGSGGLSEQLNHLAQVQKSKAILELSRKQEFSAESVGAVDDPIAMANALSLLRQKSQQTMLREKPDPIMAQLNKSTPDLIDEALHKTDSHPPIVARVAKLLKLSTEEVKQTRLPSPNISYHAVADATYIDRPPAKHIATSDIRHIKSPSIIP